MFLYDGRYSISLFEGTFYNTLLVAYDLPAFKEIFVLGSKVER